MLVDVANHTYRVDCWREVVNLIVHVRVVIFDEESSVIGNPCNNTYAIIESRHVEPLDNITFKNLLTIRIHVADELLVLKTTVQLNDFRVLVSLVVSVPYPKLNLTQLLPPF